MVQGVSSEDYCTTFRGPQAPLTQIRKKCNKDVLKREEEEYSKDEHTYSNDFVEKSVMC